MSVMMKYELIFVAWSVPYRGKVNDNYYLDKLSGTMLILHHTGNVLLYAVNRGVAPTYVSYHQ